MWISRSVSGPMWITAEPCPAGEFTRPGSATRVASAMVSDLVARSFPSSCRGWLALASVGPQPREPSPPSAAFRRVKTSCRERPAHRGPTP